MSEQLERVMLGWPSYSELGMHHPLPLIVSCHTLPPAALFPWVVSFSRFPELRLCLCRQTNGREDLIRVCTLRYRLLLRTRWRVMA